MGGGEEPFVVWGLFQFADPGELEGDVLLELGGDGVDVSGDLEAGVFVGDAFRLGDGVGEQSVVVPEIGVKSEELGGRAEQSRLFVFRSFRAGDDEGAQGGDDYTFVLRQ